MPVQECSILHRYSGGILSRRITHQALWDSLVPIVLHILDGRKPSTKPLHQHGIHVQGGNPVWLVRHQQKIFSLMYYIHISLYHLVIPSPPIPPMPLIFPSFSKGPWGFHASQNVLLASLIRRLCPSLLAYSTRKGALHH